MPLKMDELRGNVRQHQIGQAWLCGLPITSRRVLQWVTGRSKHETLGVSRGLARVIVGDVSYYTVAKTWAIASSASLPSFS